VVLLHGFPLDRTMWSHQAPALAEAGYRVILPDLRGLGKSPAGDGPATMELMAKDVARLLVGLGIGRYVLVGFSMGGYVAFELLKQMRENVVALGLIDTRAEADEPEAAQKRVESAGSVRRRGTDQVAEQMLPKFLTESTRDDHPELQKQLIDLMLAQAKPGAANALLGMAERADMREQLKAIAVPTLVIVGEKDPITPVDSAKAMADAIPGAKLVVIPDAAHLTPVERPELVTRALLDWLRKVRPVRT
jgi:pimeloyl-ACP methyl ester carboxylesterase